MFMHFLNNSLPFFSNQIHIFLLTFAILAMLQFISYLLHCIGSQTFKFLLDFLGHVSIVLLYLFGLIFFFFSFLNHRQQKMEKKKVIIYELNNERNLKRNGNLSSFRSFFFFVSISLILGVVEFLPVAGT